MQDDVAGEEGTGAVPVVRVRSGAVSPGEPSKVRGVGGLCGDFEGCRVRDGSPPARPTALGGKLIAGRLDTGEIDGQELADLAAALLVAGHETTGIMIALATRLPARPRTNSSPSGRNLWPPRPAASGITVEHAPPRDVTAEQSYETAYPSDKPD
ncbi:hypothetical protein [Streptomyces sp. NPDC093795]|uniref:hypothetical protein n=1 Tax=Streptomyces sp. NPDC093795 TaxID=3366051 RepID=UPI0037FBC64B